MASIPLLDAVGALSNTGLIACVVLGAAFDAPVWPRRTVSCPNSAHVAGLSVERVSSLKAVIGNVAILGGPALWGQSACFGAAPTLRADGVLLPSLQVCSARGCFPRVPTRTMTTTATLSMRAGVAFLWSEPLRPLLV